MKTAILKQTKKPFTLKLNDLHELGVLLNNKTTLYEVCSDLISATLKEHKVDEIVSGKTRYMSTKNQLVESKRFIVNKLKSHEFDFYDDDDCLKYVKVAENNGGIISTSYYFINKDCAQNRLIIERQKLLVRNLDLAFA